MIFKKQCTSLGPYRADDQNDDRWKTPLTVLFFILIVAVIMSACGNDAKESQDRTRRQQATVVEVAPVVAVDLQHTVAGVGTLEAVQSVSIKAEVSGRLMRADFQEGGFASKGQALFKIEQERIRKRMTAQQAGLTSIRARQENLRRNYDRLATLRKSNQVSEIQYHDAKTELEAVSADVERLEAELSLTRKDLADTTIRAPFDGFMSRRRVDPGTFVAVGETLATIYETRRLRISFFVGEKYAGRVARGQTAFASVAAYPEVVFKGEVKFISPVVVVGTRKFLVRAEIENPDNRLMPGSFASVTLVLETQPDRAVIPEQALITTRDGYVVFVVDMDNSTAHIRRVETGRRETGLVEIRVGLVPDERVVVYGHMRLEDGSPVNITERLDHDWPGENGSGFLINGTDEEGVSR